MPKTATRNLSSYGLRRPTNNSAPAHIYAAQAEMPISMRQCGREAACGNCYQPIHGPGQPAYVDLYNDNLARLMVDSDVRDRIIRKAYEDLANQSSQVPSRPALCKALARLYDHSAYTPLKVNLAATEEEYRLQRWYETNCGSPFLTASGNVAFYSRPLLRKPAVDSLIRNLKGFGVFDAMGCKGCDIAQTACPCEYQSGEKAVFARLPTQMDIQRYQELFPQPYLQPNLLDQRNQMRRMYGLVPEGPAGDAILREQQQIVQDQRALRDLANPDYQKRVYDARVDEYRRQQAGKQTRINSIMDQRGNSFPMGHGQ